MKAQQPNTRPLDHTDWELLRRLQENARLSYHELGRQIGLSATAVAERVRRMEQSGVITGYHAQVDPAQVGLPISALIQTTCIRNRCLYTNALQSEFPEVIEYHRVTGRNCGVLKVCVPSVRHLEALIDRLSTFELPTTAIVLSTPWISHVIDNEEPEKSPDVLAYG